MNSFRKIELYDETEPAPEVEPSVEDQVSNVTETSDVENENTEEGSPVLSEDLLIVFENIVKRILEKHNISVEKKTVVRKKRSVSKPKEKTKQIKVKVKKNDWIY